MTVAIIINDSHTMAIIIGNSYNAMTRLNLCDSFESGRGFTGAKLRTAKDEKEQQRTLLKNYDSLLRNVRTFS